MSGTQKVHHFLFNPYIFSLSVFLLTATLAVSTWLITSAPVAGNRSVFVAFVLVVDLLLFVPIACSRECLGWCTITEDSISLRSPLRRPLTLRYEDVQHVGAGRNFLSVSYAYWLFLSCDRVPAEQLEDMRSFRLTRRSLRIAYSSRAFAALLDCLPPDLADQLRHSRTTLRAWGVKDP